MSDCPEIHLYAWSDCPHLQQLYTGLRQLHRKRIIYLKQTIVRHPEAVGFKGLVQGSAHLLVTINGSKRLLFDAMDSATIESNHLQACDNYLKRSFDRELVSGLGDMATKVYPLGLNYSVYPSQIDLLGIWRAASFGNFTQRFKQIARVLDLPGWISYLPRENELHARPVLETACRILFLVRAWDPHGFSGCTAERVAHYTEVNEMRAACIRALRQTFGPAFTGGFSHTAFAKKHYPDVLAPDPALTSKRNYLKLLAQHPICVTSGGLHRSLGWKLGEYVALSKAIVTERLAFEVPGGFTDGQHYLSYDNAEGCVAAVQRLVDDHSLRQQMMRANHSYYLSSLRPDQLMARALNLRSE